jgi:CBS domain-containing protein
MTTDKLVKDIMLSLDQYATVPGEATLREALQALDRAQLGLTQDRHYHRAILVMDRKNRIVGKLSHWAILRALEPRLLKRDDLTSLSRAGLSADFIEAMQHDLSSITGSLKQMCRTAASIKAKDAMVPLGESVDENERLIVAIHGMVLHHVQSMLVSRDDDIVGILRLTDVFEEVANSIRGNEDC